jgi:hypothetical protein
VRKSLNLGLIWLVLAVILVGCAGFLGQTQKQQYETMTVSLETIGLTAFPFAHAYIDQRMKNGTLVGEPLLKTQQSYNLAVDKYLDAIKISKGMIAGKPPGPGQPTMQTLLVEVAKLLADLTGGKVEGTTLTMPKPAASK